MPVRIENHAEPLPGYRLIDRLGGGGFGEVWRCEAPGGFLKAIKFVYGDLQQAGDDGQRAEQELKALSRVKGVRHPYILSLERFDIIDGQLLIVMELADRNLWDRYKECRAHGLQGIPREELLRYMEEAAEALDLMNNEYQLQHLDIKPQNLFLVHQHIKVADFGLVKDLEGMQASVTGGVTPVYAAPETFDGWVSRFSDQYSLAIVYQELLTGQRPFAGTSVRQLVVQHLQAQPNLSSLPKDDQPVVARSLAKNPDERFPTCWEFVQALRQTVVPEPSALIVARPAPEAAGDGPGSAPPTPITSLVPVHSPNRKTDSSTESTQWIRAAQPAQGRPPAAPPRPAPGGGGPHFVTPEVKGEGVLFPTLIIGVGNLGAEVLSRLRQAISDRFGNLTFPRPGEDAAPCAGLPNIRILLLDTDPDVLRRATRGETGKSLTLNEVLLTPLNRPAHYLKPRDGRVSVETWLNPKMLYCIPRSQQTAGVRALGRLAFCDNYRMITRRLQTELEAALDPQALATAGRVTQLGLRSSRPRVYLVASLAGGTGSGAFLDLAYVVRQKLRQQGCTTPDVVGLFLLPNAASSRPRPLALGNAYAALTELRYFSTPGQAFFARYHENEPAVRDDEPPFSRCLLLPLPDESDERATGDLVAQAAEFLFRDTCSPLGKEADLARAGMSSPPWKDRGLFYHTFGLYKITSPQRPMLHLVAKRLCRVVVARWMSKDSAPMQEAVAGWVRERWEQEGWGPASLLEAVQNAARETLHQPAEEVFQGILNPLLPRPPRPGEPGSANGASSRPSRQAPAEADPALLGPALEVLEKLLGPPEGQEILGATATLTEALRTRVEKLVAAWGERVAEFAVSLIEQPEFRLAGAEEAVRQIVARIEKVLGEFEARHKQLRAQSADAYARLGALLDILSRPPNKRPRDLCTAAGSVELLRLYAASRYETLLHHLVISAYISLRGHLSDELREINFCRVRLAELAQRFDDNEADSAARECRGSGKALFPEGCRTLNEAAEQFIGTIEAEDLLALDGRIQGMIREQFTALVHVCLTTANVLKNLQAAMQQEAEAFIAPRLAGADAAELFLSQHAREEEAVGEIVSASDEAAPELAAARTRTEFTILAVPPGPAGDRFRTLAARAMGDATVVPASSPDDIILYREAINLPLANLEQLAEAGAEAYKQLSSAANFTPHARIDISFQ